MKKSSKLVVALAAMSFLVTGALFAADKAESKPGKCCVKATEAGSTCTHKCCVAAAKEGNNCTKCGGSGKIAKTETKK